MSNAPRKAPPSFVIVQRQPRRRWLLWLAVAVAWVMSLAAVWASCGYFAPERPAGESAALHRLHQQLGHYQERHEALKQRVATLKRSDQISRVANKEIQSALAEREDEIADLRADVAFYERLVGATAPKKGLNVHSSRFEREVGGTWRYQIVLTQTLNRNAISLGELRFSVEGVYDGKLASIGWDELHQKRAAPGQDYSFRYFQQIEGSVMLPPGFTPQRVRVSLRGDGAAVDQTLAWTTSDNGATASSGDSTSDAITNKDS
ncbi:DUF6776 family protein [Lysobacter sp. D1-1-M9]|uniref:DUF6776 family protein n=2 Tax=Novilysobacter TaxID=3382699 RepID=UPI002FCBBAC2